MTPADLAAKGLRGVHDPLRFQEVSAILRRHGRASHLPAGPNRNGSHEDRVMAAKALPSTEVLRQLLRYDPETGKLFWIARPVDMFGSKGGRIAPWACCAWNSRYANKEAFTFTDSKGYRVGRVLKVNFLAHRVIWAMQYSNVPSQIDHINGDKSDNRLENLRACTNAENSANYRRKTVGSSQYRGVSWVIRDKVWRSSIGVSMRKIHLGDFKNPIMAAHAYDEAAILHHGDFAVLNFPAAAEAHHAARVAEMIEATE